MSYDYREGGVPFGTAVVDGSVPKKGSVRAARERLQAAQRAQLEGIIATNQARLGLPTRPNQLVSQFSVPRPAPQDVPTPPSSNGSLGARGAPSPQWPLRGNLQDDDDDDDSDMDDSDSEDEDDYPLRNVGVAQRPAQDRAPPQRPPRPTVSPPQFTSAQDVVLQAPQPQSGFPAARAALLSPSDASSTWQDEEGYLSPTFGAASPNTSRPITTSSRASTTSSLGSIPDFPLPNVGPMQRKSPNLGPPPSARRGPSSYYSSHMSYVSPIKEESEGTRSHNSFASSNVIPNDTGFYFDEEDISPSDEEELLRSEARSPQSDTSNLVRQASLGRRTKPSLMTIKTSDSSSKQSSDTDTIPDIPLQSNAQLGGPTILFDPSSSSESESASVHRKPAGPPPVSPLPRSPPASARSPIPRSPMARSPLAAAMTADTVMNDYGNETSTGSAATANRRPGSLAQRVGARRPPRINVDAVREAEARGSLTSLPDLIRRATRLAANLDRGKTASRLGLEFYENGAFEKTAREKKEEEAAVATRRSGSLSDMLASFPPPGIATPNAEKSDSQQMTRWPSPNDGMSPSEKGSDPRREKRGRRCCGMPFWGFIILISILFLLIASAVIIPIVLIVLPRQSNSMPSTSPSAVTQCGNGLTCQNGGLAISSADGSCRCLCANGFTGASCTTPSDASCVTTEISTVSNATLGSAIPRLLSGASNFSVPLDGSLLLSDFSESNLSCTAENALVTFNGLSSRSLDIDIDMPLLGYADAPIIPAPSPLVTQAVVPRMVSSAAASQTVFTVSLITITSNSILIEVSPTPSIDPSKTVASTAASATPTASTSLSGNSTVLDFARISVLFILQDTNKLDPAVTAQQRLQTFIDNTAIVKGNSASNLTLGNGFFIDLVDLRLSLPNGSFVGLGSGSTSSTASRSTS